MNFVPDNLPYDPELLKQMLAKMQSRMGVLEEQVALLRQRLFGRKSEQAVDPATPQMALVNEAEHEVELACETTEEEVVAPAKRRGKRKPLSADLPRIEVIHELPEHELTCACGCRKFVEAQKVQPKGKTGRADIALNLINKLYGIERELKACGDAERKIGRHEQSLPILVQLKSKIEKTQPQVTAQNALGKAISYLASNRSKLERYVEESYLPQTITPLNARSAPS